MNRLRTAAICAMIAAGASAGGGLQAYAPMAEGRRVVAYTALQQPAGAPPAIRTVAAQLAKSAGGSQMQQCLDTLTASRDQRAVQDALAQLKGCLGQDSDAQISDTLLAMLAGYGNDAASVAGLDSLSKSNICSALQMLSQSSAAWLNSALACENAVSTLANLLCVGRLACNLLAGVCEHWEGNLSAIGPMMQKYAAFLVAGLDSESYGQPERGCYAYAQRECFIRIYAVAPASVARADAERVLRRWMRYPGEYPFRNPWQALLAGISGQPTDAAVFGAFVRARDSLGADSEAVGLGVSAMAWCTQNQDSAHFAAMMALAGMDSAVAQAVRSQVTYRYDANSLMWDEISLERSLYALSRLAQWKKGEPVVATILAGSCIPLKEFGSYPESVLRHLYEDRDRASGRPVMLMVFTTRPGGIDFPEMAFGAFDYTKFDIRVIYPGYPGTDTALLSMAKETQGRLGKRFSCLLVNCHGGPGGVLLKRTDGTSSASLDVGDTALLKALRPLFVDNPDVVLDACATAGDNNGAMNVAQTVALYLRARCFGAAQIDYGLTGISFDSGLQITSVTFDKSPTVVYDYSATAAEGRPAPGPDARAARYGAVFTISAGSGSACCICDLRGRVVAHLAQDASGRFTWDPSGCAAGEYVARISRAGRATTIKLGSQRP